MRTFLALAIPAILTAQATFQPFDGKFPADHRELQVDSAGNQWLVRFGILGVHTLEDPAKPNPWVFNHEVKQVATDTHGNRWVISGSRLSGNQLTVLPLGADRGKSLEGHSPSLVTRSPDGRAMFYEDGNLYHVSLGKDGDFEVSPFAEIKGATQFSVDAFGHTYAKTSKGIFKLEAPKDAWQRNWEEVGILPGSNHDLSGDILGGDFYMAGGLTAEWGLPLQSKCFDTVLSFEPETRSWNTVGQLLHPRRYNATSHLDGEIWVIGGDKGKGHPPLGTVEILNLNSKHVRQGPPLPAPISMCTAHNIGGRLYVLGKDKDSNAPSNFYSIGKGDCEWSIEKEAPDVAGPIVSTSDCTNIYVIIPHKHLAIYNTHTKKWKTVPIPTPPRSCQVAFHKGELWLMGGRGVPGGKATQVYNPQTNKWRDGPDLPRELVWGTAFSSEGDLYVAGGAAGSCYSNRTFRLR